MSGHTPGPWRIQPTNMVGQFLVSGGNIQGEDGFSLQFSEGNARLIAAAPELLSALKLFVDAVKYNRLYMGFEKAFEVGSELIERLEGCK